MSRNASLILTLRPRLTLLGILLLGYLALRGSHALAGFDGWLLEWQEQLLAPPPNPVVVVEIDEASLATHGQWPWSRHKHAALVAWLDAAGAAAIGLDMIFAEPSRFGVPDDAALAAAMQHSGRVVLPVAVDSAAAPPGFDRQHERRAAQRLATQLSAARTGERRCGTRPRPDGIGPERQVARAASVSEPARRAAAAGLSAGAGANRR